MKSCLLSAYFLLMWTNCKLSHAVNCTQWIKLSTVTLAAHFMNESFSDSCSVVNLHLAGYVFIQIALRANVIHDTSCAVESFGIWTMTVVCSFVDLQTTTDLRSNSEDACLTLWMTHGVQSQT